MHFPLLHFEPLSIITIPICSYWQYILKFQSWLKIWNLLETLKFFVSVLLLVLKIANQCMRNLLVNYGITMTGCVMFFLPENTSCNGNQHGWPCSYFWSEIEVAMILSAYLSLFWYRGKRLSIAFVCSQNRAQRNMCMCLHCTKCSILSTKNWKEQYIFTNDLFW